MNKKVEIIAEAGVNHNGELNLAKQLIIEAAKAGADVIKFQTFNASKLVSENADLAEYQKKASKINNTSQLQMLKKLELKTEWFPELIELSKSHQIDFCSTAFDIESLDFLLGYNIPFIKIASGEITNLPFLEYIGSLNKKTILSTGMSTLHEVVEAKNILLKSGMDLTNLYILHCNTEYPTPFEDVNLFAMLQIKELVCPQVGYSDHTLGIEVPVAAVALGAIIIEKHLTLDKSLEGPDHQASLNPIEFKNMVEAIRNIEMALSGNGKKEPSKSEIKNINVARKSLHYASNLLKGNSVNKNNFEVKRPGNGISAMDIMKLEGKILNKNVLKGQLVNYSDFI